MQQLEEQMESMKEALDTEQFDHKKTKEASQAHVQALEHELQQLQQLNEKLEEQLKEAAVKQPKAMHASASPPPASATDVEAVTKLQTEMQHLQQQLQAAPSSDTVAALEQDKAALQKEMQQLPQLNQKLESKVAELAGLQARFADLESSLAKAKEGKVLAEKEIETVIAREHVLKGTVEGKSIRITALEAELAKNKELLGMPVPSPRVVSVTSDMALLEEAKAMGVQMEKESDRRIKHLQLKLTEAQAQLSAVDQELLACKNARVSDRKELEETKTQMSGLQSELASANTLALASKTASGSVAALQQELASKTVELMQASKEAQIWQKRVDALEAQVALEVQQHALLRDRHTAATAASTGASASAAASTTVETDALRTKIDMLEEQLAEARARLDSNKGVDALQHQVTACVYVWVRVRVWVWVWVWVYEMAKLISSNLHGNR
jgi:chromosome segregation ATPase